MISVMKRRHTTLKRTLLLVLVMLLCVSYTGYALTQPLAALSPTLDFAYSRQAQKVSLHWPSYGEAAIGATGYGVLATHGPDKPLATASVAKIMTALCVLHQKPMVLGETGPVITLSKADVDSYNKYVAMDGSVVRVEVGEQLTEYEALEALLLPSANNIADTLARWAFGSVDAYNIYANGYAVTLGMTATTITDPSGFLPTTTSSPEDLVILGENALADPVVAQIVAMPQAAIPVQGPIRNVNVLLGAAGIVGIKTGNNDQDLGCFLFASKQKVGNHEITIVGVIMDGPALGTAMWDALPLIKSAAKSFSVVTVAKAGEVVGSYTIPWQQPVQAVAQRDLSFVAWNGTPVSANLDLETEQVPGITGKYVGTVHASADTNYTVPVILQQPITRPNIFWRLAHPL